MIYRNVSCLSLLTLLTVLLTVIAPFTASAQDTAQSPVQIAVSDPNIQYIGRWDKSNPTLYYGYWGTVYLRTRFTGTSVSIKLNGGTGLVVSIDNEAFRPLNASGGVVALNSNPLKPGNHSLLVGSAGQNFEVPFQGLVLDSGAMTLPPLSVRPIIEFVGDSITALTGSPCGGTNWAWYTAEALDCDHTQIAFSGRALTTGYGCASDKAALDTQYLCLKNFNHLNDSPQPQWNFSYTPAIVVVNLGQNDQCGAEPASTFQASYVSFLKMLRSHFPSAKLVAMRTYGGPYETSIKAAVDELRSQNDMHVYYIDTTGWLSKTDFADGIHPNGIGNLKIMGHLIPLLRSALSAQ